MIADNQMQIESEDDECDGRNNNKLLIFSFRIFKNKQIISKLTFGDEALANLPGEDGWIFAFVLFDLGDDGGSSDFWLGSADDTRWTARMMRIVRWSTRRSTSGWSARRGRSGC